MGFETQEEAERWAENMEFRAEQIKDERFALQYQPPEVAHIKRLEEALEWAAKNFDMIAAADRQYGKTASAELADKQAKECRDAIAAK